MKGQGFSIKLNGIIGFVVLVGILVLLFFVAKGLFSILSLAAPVLIALALIINYKTVVNYLRFMLGLLRRNVLGGIIAIILSVVGFPILSGVLFGKAILDRKVKRLQEARKADEQGEEVDYEEVIRPEREDSLKLPQMEKPKPEPKENPYKDLF
jgi:uncharacterized membrane protein YccC